MARVRAVRSAIGPTVPLGVDANGGWSPVVAIETIRRLEEFDISFAEQPVAPGDLESMAQVRRQAHVPVIADESVYTAQDARALARAGAADAVSIYIGKSGGIGPAREIAAVAEMTGLSLTIGSNLELGVGSAAMLHFALSITSDLIPCDIIGPLYYEEDVLREPLLIGAGEARALERPGLGVELDEEKIRRFRVR